MTGACGGSNGSGTRRSAPIKAVEFEFVPFWPIVDPYAWVLRCRDSRVLLCVLQFHWWHGWGWSDSDSTYDNGSQDGFDTALDAYVDWCDNKGITVQADAAGILSKGQ